MVVVQLTSDSPCSRLLKVTEGIAIAKEAKKYKGKQKNKELHNKIIDMLQAGKNTPDEIAKLCDCGRATVFRVKKEMLASTGSIEN